MFTKKEYIWQLTLYHFLRIFIITYHTSSFYFGLGLGDLDSKYLRLGPGNAALEILQRDLDSDLKAGDLHLDLYS